MAATMGAQQEWQPGKTGNLFGEMMNKAKCHCHCGEIKPHRKLLQVIKLTSDLIEILCDDGTVWEIIISPIGWHSRLLLTVPVPQDY